MSRPKALVNEEMKPLQAEIADYLESVCNIPGCIPKLHAEDAENILQIIRDYVARHKEEVKSQDASSASE